MKLLVELAVFVLAMNDADTAKALMKTENYDERRAILRKFADEHNLRLNNEKPV